MKQQRFPTARQSYTLAAESIDAASEHIQSCLAALEYDSRSALRLRLSMEEILLCWRDRFGEDTVCVVTTGYRFRKPYILLELTGEPYDPLAGEAADVGEWGMELLSHTGLTARYSYSNGRNICRFDLKAPALNPLYKLAAAILLAALCGALGMLMPESLRLTLANEGLTRLSDTFYSLLGMIAGPLVFLSVVMGICGIGDTATLGGIGKKIIGSFLGISTVACAVAAVAYSLAFGLRPAQSGAAVSGLWELVDMVLGMVPENILSPFTSGNSLQIIVLALGIGIAMLVLGKRTEGVYTLLEQLQQVVQTVMAWIGALLPVLIFIVILENIWTGSMANLVGVWKPFVFVLVMLAVLLAALLVLSALRLHTRPLTLLRKLLPTFMIALTTASSTAAMGALYNCCEKELGVPKRLVHFGVPLGIVTGVAGSCVGFLACTLYAAQCYDTELSLVALVVAVLSTVLLLVAAPPVAGGTLSCYAVIFAQLGVPVEAVGIIVTLNIFIDFFCTAVNVSLIALLLGVGANRKKAA